MKSSPAALACACCPALVCALLFAVALAACGKSGGPAGSDKPAAPPSVQARVLTVKAQRIPVRLDLVGQVEGSKEVEVRARVAGILQKRLYQEGDVVAQGKPLFQIDPAPFEIAVAQARAQLAQERARNEQARREAARLKQLAEEKAISQKEYDDATSVAKLSDASIAVAEANLKQAQLNLSYTLVGAPVSGVSGRALRSEGSLISPGADSLLTTINQLDPVWVRFSLAESDLAKLPGGRLAPGGAGEVKLTLADGSVYPGRGRLNFAATQIDPRLATQQVRAEFDNPRKALVPGQFVRIALIAGERDNVFLVPQTAVVQNEKGFFLFVLNAEAKAEMRPVRTGEWIGQDWLILDGLKSGERVVVDNLLKLRPGATVTPTADAPPAAPAAGTKPPGAA